MKQLLTIMAGLLIFCSTSYGFKQEVINVPSKKMNKDVPVTVITPDKYESAKALPVIYILHGFSDDNTRWTTRDVVGGLADQYQIIFILPDGGYDSWYFDSPLCPDYQYETFVSSELISHIDSNYKTIPNRAARAITGQSMGGHGAMYVGFRHQELFGSIGSMSGAVDIRPYPGNWGIAKRIGPKEENPEIWEKNTVINLTHLLTPGGVNIIFDCGTEDILFDVNCALHQKLMDEKIPHDFYVRPGGHNWTYWRNAIKYQVMFFNDRFDRQVGQEN